MRLFPFFFGKTASIHKHSIDFVVITKGNTVGIVEKIEWKKKEVVQTMWVFAGTVKCHFFYAHHYSHLFNSIES